MVRILLVCGCDGWWLGLSVCRGGDVFFFFYLLL